MLLVDYVLDLVIGYSLLLGWRQERRFAQQYDYRFSAQLVSYLFKHTVQAAARGKKNEKGARFTNISIPIAAKCSSITTFYFKVSVWGRAQLSPVPYKLSPWTHFIILHKRYIDPSYVLENDNVTLQGVTETHAFFCVTSHEEDVQDIKEMKQIIANGTFQLYFFYIVQCLAIRQKELAISVECTTNKPLSHDRSIRSYLWPNFNELRNSSSCHSSP